MANTVLTPSIIAKRALARLENELGVLGKFHRAYEDEFASQVNGYKKGDTISIRRPVDYVLRDGNVMNLQDSIEGKVTLTIDQQKGVDMYFTSKDMTLSISQFDERFIKSAVSTIVNGIAADCMATFLPQVYNYVGTPGTLVDSFSDFNKVVERANYLAIPMDGRTAILNPSDHAALVSNLTGLYIQSDAKGAYRNGSLGQIADVETLMTQVIPGQSYGTADNTTPLVRGTGQQVTYETAKDTWTQSFSTDGWDSSATITAGTVFTVADLNMVNPRTKVDTGIAQQFVVTASITADATTSNDSPITISPPIIMSGPHQTCTFAPGVSTMNDKAITIIGTASTTKAQNVLFAKGAFALAMVPMEMPQAVGDRGARESYKGISIRLVPVYDGVNDVEKWRLDVLYGRKTIDPRLAVRFSGT